MTARPSDESSREQIGDQTRAHNCPRKSAQRYNSRLGLALLLVYIALYAGFVLLNASNPDLMTRRGIGGMNLAFSFASPMIKRIFRNPGNFGMMVENGYPMVWDNADVRFVGLREEAGTFVQTVQMKDASGMIHTLEYLMIETSEGWQINGVQLVETDLAA